MYYQTFDTADTYSQGNSERILGKFLKAYNIPRESVVILTKAFFKWGDEDSYGPAGFVNNGGLSRKVSISRHRWSFIDEIDYRGFLLLSRVV
jgi:aryl-alcohol dehydrogenase-like predicted oxidoreductase